MFYDELAEEVEFCSRATQSRAVEEAWVDGTIYCIQIMHYGTPHELLYGSNLPRLKCLAAEYDPEKIMTLADGFSSSVRPKS